MALTTSSLRGGADSGRPTPIRITRATVFRGRAVDVGAEFLDATGAEAAVLIGCGKATRIPLPLSEPVKTAAIQTPEPIRETASVEPRTETASIPSEPAPHARKRRARQE